MKSFLLILPIIFFTITINAQVGIGTLFPDGALDITSTTDGLVIPRVALSATAIVFPVITAVESELVYNTATAGDVTPGFYYLSTPIGPWVRLSTATVSTTDWNIIGNTNIVDGVNFLGTGLGTNVDVAFRRNNIASGKIGAASTSFGLGALTAGATTNNTAFGTNALTNTTTGTDNVAIGNGALATNLLGIGNTAVGTSTLATNTASGNTAIGNAALTTNVAGTNNTAIGNGALALNVSGNSNTAIGTNALNGNVTNGNTAMGFNALKGNVGSSGNTAVGFASLATNTAANNTAVGSNALTLNAGATNNTAVGANSLSANNSGGDNTALGYNSLKLNTSSIGAGNQNTAIGSGALGAINGGALNTAIGYNALAGNAGLCQFNTAVGALALNGINNSASNYNTAVGYNALPKTGVILNCVAIGYNALPLATGNALRNTAVGDSAGSNITTGSYNVAIGYNSQVPIATGQNQIRLGDNSITYAGIQVAWTITSDRRWKDNIKATALGLDFLKTLRPVSYFRNNDVNKKTEYGFIAQEVEDSFIKAGDVNNAVISKDDNGMYGVRYNDFIAITVKAVQEQQLQIENLKEINANLKKTNEAILKRLEELEKR